MTVKQFPGTKPIQEELSQVNESLVESLEELLVRAKVGHLQSVLAVGLNDDGTIMMLRGLHSESRDMLAAIGGLEILKAKCIQHSSMETVP